MSVHTPVIVINFKVYESAIGENAFRLAQYAQEISDELGVTIVVCPAATDIYRIASELHIPVWAQAVDAVPPGSHTGRITVEQIKLAGATGTLINHSENRLQIADIEWLVAKSQALKIECCVCTNNVPTSVACAVLKPDFIAVEPPELIGGDISVTTADPQIVANTVEQIRTVNKDVKVLCGAGVKTNTDVKKALSLGTDGVLLASGITKAKEPRKTIYELATALR